MTTEVDIITSEVDIIFNRNFKEFIKQLKLDNAMLIKSISKHSLNNDDLDYVIAVSEQKKLRDYIVKNQHKLSFRNSRRLKEGFSKSMPNFFLLFACYTLHDIDEVNEFEDIMPQLIVLFNGTKMTDAFTMDKMDMTDKVKCCCSHYCSYGNMYCFENPATKLRFLTGCDCVKKSKLIGDVVIDEAIKTKRQNKNIIKKNELKIKEALVKKKMSSLKNVFFELRNLVTIKKTVLSNLFTVVKTNVMKNAFMKMQQLIRTCKECGNNIYLKDYKEWCSKKTCDCQTPWVRNSYCVYCANKKYSKI